ncbi:MAG: biotin--[acetyl-CoA-carboxylase] ligase [Candidatus Zixiibacteriota bacterium]
MNQVELEKKADDLLLRLRRRPGVYFKANLLAKNLITDENEFTVILNLIKDLGYKIRFRSDTMAFIKAPDILTPTEISYRLKTKVIGHNITAYRSVKSTNDLAAELAEAGAPEGTIVTAEEQTRGRGRLGRDWHSPAGTGIYVSIILRPRFKPEKAPGLSIMTAVALADTINRFCNGEVRIKWPNDILINGRKTAGILTELVADKDKISHIVVGTGINVNLRGEDFPAELKDNATSLRRVNRKKVSRVEVLKTFLYFFEREYRDYPKYGLKKSHGKIKKYSSLLGQTIKILEGKNIIEGTAVDIDFSGRLILERNGVKTPISAGEVTVVKRD